MYAYQYIYCGYDFTGSDMDGDEYSVVWFKDLIFHGPNERPADFDSPQVPPHDIPFISVSIIVRNRHSFHEKGVNYSQKINLGKKNK